MNLVGKIFTVLIFVMSLVFMSFAVAVYATHQNWREVVLGSPDEGGKRGLKFELERERTKNRELADQKLKLEGDLDVEKKAREQAVSKLETEHSRLKSEHTELEKRYAEENTERRKAVGAMVAAQNTLKSLRTEVEGLRDRIAKAEKDRDAHFDQAALLNEQLNQLVNERQRLKGRLLTLTEDLQKAEAVLRKLGYKKDSDLSGIPPLVDGVVVAVPRADLVEISLGSDDGLMAGHKLEVYRTAGGTNTYVGRIVVVRTTYDQAACKVLPNFRQSSIQRGDRVTTKIK